MPPSPPDSSDPRRELHRVGRDVAHMLTARWELAELEYGAARRDALRLAVVLAFTSVLATVGMALLGEALAQWLGEVSAWPPQAWRIILASVSIFGAAAAAGLGYRRFRREFTGFSESLEEMREDIVWLREWSSVLGGATESKSDPEPRGGK
jgi:hypothetical protein